ncbi:hypothetical protein RND81_12G178000 [Saponaria officinalis]|uniref:Uncharacterized protein n=1 Tax=Saponaria officinalis TaxID=3572 RepID=A0AAW1HC87_SAPOF
MRCPHNLKTSKDIKGVIRENKAIIAAMTILDGIPDIGLHIEELEWLAKFGAQVHKTARPRHSCCCKCSSYFLAFTIPSRHHVIFSAETACLCKWSSQ